VLHKIADQAWFDRRLIKNHRLPTMDAVIQFNQNDKLKTTMNMSKGLVELL